MPATIKLIIVAIFFAAISGAAAFIHNDGYKSGKSSCEATQKKHANKVKKSDEKIKNSLPSSADGAAQFEWLSGTADRK